MPTITICTRPGRLPVIVGGRVWRVTDSSVQSYISALKASIYDYEKFAQIISALDSDGSIKVEDMREIAKGVLGYELAKSKGRSKAVQEMKLVGNATARQHSRAERIR